MAVIAADEGISTEEAHARYSWHNEFVVIAGQLEAAYPESFADAKVNEPGFYEAAVWFRGPAANAVHDILATSPVPVTVYSDAPVS